MVRPISTSPEASATTFHPSVNSLPHKNLQYGVSTLTQGASVKKSVVILVLLGVGALLVFLWRKLFSARSAPIPTEIQEWVKQNCADLDLKHQEGVSSAIIRTRRKLERTGSTDVIATINELIHSMSTCATCNTIKAHVIRYFETHPIAPPPPVDVVPETEIRGFIAKRWPDLPEEDVRQVIERVHAIERQPVFQSDPTKRIGALRLQRQLSDTIGLKAIVYLSHKHQFLRK